RWDQSTEQRYFKPQQAIVPSVQTTSTPIITMEKTTARTERKNTSMISPVTTADRIVNMESSFFTCWATTDLMNGSPA
ncbi:MAG: hypothetical protein WDN75_15625, partial [Bacteroidota bacterium]